MLIASLHATFFIWKVSRNVPGRYRVQAGEYVMPNKTAPNWVIGTETEQGPPDREQVHRLAKDADLSESDIDALSQSLAYALSDRFFPRGVTKVAKQMAKGPSELEKLIRELRHAEARLHRAIELYSNVQVQFPAVKRGVSDPNIHHRAALDTALRSVQRINQSLARSAKKDSAHFTGDPDKRRSKDERRSAVLFAIFDIWQAAGRKVTISTIGSSSERTGPLVDFTNAVVRCVTDPPTNLSGETIRSEIKDWRRFQKFEDASVEITDK